MFFDGYGISIFILHWDYFKKYLSGNIKYLFSINFIFSYDEGAKTLDIFGSLLFFGCKLYSKQLTPKKDRCDYCGDICYTTKFYKDNIPYCEDCNN